jgi:hypothetical protein
MQVALKTLIVVHRLLREGDPTFKEEFLAYSYRGNILHLANFRDDSSPLGTSSVSCRTNCETLIQYALLVTDASFPPSLTLQLGIAPHGFAPMRSSWRNGSSASGP